MCAHAHMLVSVCTRLCIAIDSTLLSFPEATESLPVFELPTKYNLTWRRPLRTKPECELGLTDNEERGKNRFRGVGARKKGCVSVSRSQKAGYIYIYIYIAKRAGYIYLYIYIYNEIVSTKGCICAAIHANATHTHTYSTPTRRSSNIIEHFDLSEKLPTPHHSNL
jgi:hypothetical protein